MGSGVESRDWRPQRGWQVEREDMGERTKTEWEEAPMDQEHMVRRNSK